jgi:hypothetical protein
VQQQQQRDYKQMGSVGSISSQLASQRLLKGSNMCQTHGSSSSIRSSKHSTSSQLALQRQQQHD